MSNSKDNLANPEEHLSIPENNLANLNIKLKTF